MRLAAAVNTLVQLGAVASAMLLLTRSRPVRSLTLQTRQLRRDGTESSLMPIWLIAFVLSVGVALGVAEVREVQSPVAGLPVVGALASRLTHPLLGPALMFGAAAAAALLRLGAKGRSCRGPDVAQVALLVWIAVCIAATAMNSDGASSTSTIQFAASAAAIWAVVVAAPLAPQRLTLDVLAILSACFIVVTLVLYMASPEWSTTARWPGGFLEGPRLQGPTPQPNVLALLLALMCLVVVRARILGPWTRLVVLLVAVGLLFLTGSRGGLVALSGLLLGAVLTGRPQWIRRCAAVGAILVATLVPFVVSAGADVINGRGATWATASSMVREHPLLGAGVFPETTLVGRTGFYAHNQVLQSVVETGAIGALAVLVGAVAAVSRARAAGAACQAGFCMLATFSFENPLRIYELGFVPLTGLALTLLLVQGLAPPRSPLNEHTDHGLRQPRGSV